MSETLLYTLGHSNHSLEAFLGLLEAHEIGAVADVRSSPYSRFCPHFNQAELRQALSGRDIAYTFLGKELGARPANPGCYVDGKVSYARLAEQAEFHEGLQRVRQGAERFRLALLCAEKDPIVCHRMILVCRHLRGPGVAIRHILADGAVETNAAAEARLCRTLQLQADLFTSEAEVIEMAYTRQGERIAYSQSQATVTAPEA